jgi:hypothetical protein
MDMKNNALEANKELGMRQSDRPVTNKREVEHQIHAMGCIPLAGRRSTVTVKCFCGRNKMLEAAKALDGTRLEQPGMELDTRQERSDECQSQDKVVRSRQTYL